MSYRDLHLRFHHDGWIESLTIDDRRQVAVDLLRLSRAIATDSRLATEVLNRPIEANVQHAFTRVVAFWSQFYVDHLGRQPSLPEMTEDMHELLPWMTHDELMTRLRAAAEEVPV